MYCKYQTKYISYAIMITNYIGGHYVIQRKNYVDSLISFRDKQLIKVVTGIKRCGKSTLLELFRDYLRARRDFAP